MDRIWLDEMATFDDKQVNAIVEHKTSRVFGGSQGGGKTEAMRRVKQAFADTVQARSTLATNARMGELVETAANATSKAQRETARRSLMSALVLDGHAHHAARTLCDRLIAEARGKHKSA